MAELRTVKHDGLNGRKGAKGRVSGQMQIESTNRDSGVRNAIGRDLMQLSITVRHDANRRKPSPLPSAQALTGRSPACRR
jgi:hypothetical protein